MEWRGIKRKGFHGSGGGKETGHDKRATKTDAREGKVGRGPSSTDGIRGKNIMRLKGLTQQPRVKGNTQTRVMVSIPEQPHEPNESN